MSIMSEQFIEKLNLALPTLKNQWNGSVELTEVQPLDHFYSDGISVNAICKLVLRYSDPAKYNVCFIFADGTTTHIFEQETQKLVVDWVNRVKRDL
jgi:hypothetical protein